MRCVEIQDGVSGEELRDRQGRRFKRMTQVQTGVIRDSEVIEIVGDSFAHCYFFDCEFTGTGGNFFGCVFKNCSFVSNRMRNEFDQCAFEWTGKRE